MSVSVENKVALVTGANRGIGKSIVETFIENGASKVYLAVRDVSTTSELVEKFGNKVSPIELDMNQPHTIVEAAKKASDVQILVNNAGLLKPTEILSDGAIESLQQELTVNTFGLLRVAHAFAKSLKENEDTALVQLNSVASIKNFDGLTTYSASKAASYSITQGLRNSLAPHNVSVLSVHPGPINTDMAVQGGMTDIAEPPSVVAEGIVRALKTGQFHLFPDSMARDFGGAYDSYAKNIVEVDLS